MAMTNLVRFPSISSQLEKEPNNWYQSQFVPSRGAYEGNNYHGSWREAPPGPPQPFDAVLGAYGDSSSIYHGSRQEVPPEPPPSSPITAEDMSRSLRRGSPEGRRSATKEERMMVLEGSILNLNSKFDGILENRAKIDRMLEELLRTRGRGEAQSPTNNMASSPPPPPPPLQIPSTSQYIVAAPPSSLGHHHLPQLGARFIGIPNPMFPLEQNLVNQHVPVAMRANPGPIPQFEQKNHVSQESRISQGFNIIPIFVQNPNLMSISNILDSSFSMSNTVQKLEHIHHQPNFHPSFIQEPGLGQQSNQFPGIPQEIVSVGMNLSSHIASHGNVSSGSTSSGFSSAQQQFNASLGNPSAPLPPPPPPPNQNPCQYQYQVQSFDYSHSTTSFFNSQSTTTPTHHDSPSGTNTHLSSSSTYFGNVTTQPSSMYPGMNYQEMPNHVYHGMNHQKMPSPVYPGQNFHVMPGSSPTIPVSTYHFDQNPNPVLTQGTMPLGMNFPTMSASYGNVLLGNASFTNASAQPFHRVAHMGLSVSSSIETAQFGSNPPLHVQTPQESPQQVSQELHPIGVSAHPETGYAQDEELRNGRQPFSENIADVLGNERHILVERNGVAWEAVNGNMVDDFALLTKSSSTGSFVRQHLPNSDSAASGGCYEEDFHLATSDQIERLTNGQEEDNASLMSHVNNASEAHSLFYNF